MIPEKMKNAADAFGRYLRRQRKARGLGSTALSERIGRDRTYLGRWERDPAMRPKRDVLLKVAEALGLTESERRELFRLADLRGAPGSAKHLYQPSVDPDLLLLEALLEVEHEAAFPRSAADAHTSIGGTLVRAVGTALAEIATFVSLMADRPELKPEHRRALDAARGHFDLLHPYTRIAWPKPFVRLGIVPRPSRSDNPVDIPDELTDSQFRHRQKLKILPSLPPGERSNLSTGMARVYRSILLSDPGRIRKMLGAVKRWSFNDRAMPQPRLSLRFADSDLNQSFEIDDIDWSVVWRCAERSIAGRIWTTYALFKDEGRELQNPWLCEWSDSDWMGLMIIVWTLTGDPRDEDPSESVRDAIYMLRSPVWKYIQEAIRHKFNVPRALGVVPELQRQVAMGALDDDMVSRLRAEPWLIAGVRHDVLLAHMHTVRLVGAKLTDARGKPDPAQADRPTTPEPHEQPAGGRKARERDAQKRKTKRKAKQGTKRKPKKRPKPKRHK